MAMLSAPPALADTLPASCTCCGGRQFDEQPVLWTDLISAWQLTEEEVSYINRQQGLRCRHCRSSLRSMALAHALMTTFGFQGVFARFVRTWRARRLKVLEINKAGDLTPFLSRLPRHLLVSYPEVDMLALPFEDSSFDVVVHSDTLEHVPDPVRGLAECRRVLRPGGCCAFTIPVIVGRLTHSREGMSPSYHGSPKNPSDCLVHTEYGADAWTHVILAGFRECRIVPLQYPAASAFICRK